MADTHYDAALNIADGAVSGAIGADVTGSAGNSTGSTGLAITSSREARNGLIVAGGKSAYTLRKAVIRLSGSGTNDFLGTGAGVLVRDGATLILDGSTIETSARVSSAAVAAEGATLRVYDSTLIANGGPLPADYKPHIGPGMMEPPAPLGLSGTARALLAMSNSHTFLYRSRIEAGGWGALSTDATGGSLYLEANDCTVVVRQRGYGTYADFGAHVVINRGTVESGGDIGIIAGKAQIDLNGVGGHAGRNGVMIHSVMAFDPAETAELSITDSTFVAAGPVVQVKSANAEIVIKGGSVRSESGVLLEVRRNDDPNATKTGGKPVPGVHLTIRDAKLAGDVVVTDTDRSGRVDLVATSLLGAIKGAVLHADAASHWTARADSDLVTDRASLAAIDALQGVTVRARVDGAAAASRALPGGGRLEVLPR